MLTPPLRLSLCWSRRCPSHPHPRPSAWEAVHCDALLALLPHKDERNCRDRRTCRVEAKLPGPPHRDERNCQDRRTGSSEMAGTAAQERAEIAGTAAQGRAKLPRHMENLHIMREQNARPTTKRKTAKKQANNKTTPNEAQARLRRCKRQCVLRQQYDCKKHDNKDK